MAMQAPKTPKPAAKPPVPANKEPFFPKKGSDGAFFKPTPPAAQYKTVSSGVVELSSNQFSPTQLIKDEIEANADKGLEVLIKIKDLTGEGKVKVRANNKNYDSIDQGSMPWLNPWSQQLGGLYINFNIKNNEIQEGFATLKPKGGDKIDWLTALNKQSNLLGGLGLKIKTLPTPINQLENGKLTLGVKKMKVEIGGYLDTLFSFRLENNEKPKIEANATLDIKGLVKNELQLNNTSGSLAGQAALTIDYKGFNGAAQVVYKPDGSIDIAGKAAYNSDKLSGEIQFVATDLESADHFAKDAISAAGGKENIQNITNPPPVPAAEAKSKKRALAATGMLSFNLTNWFAGRVNVIVDGKGQLTVVGKIAPPVEIELFKQKDFPPLSLFATKVKAYYGIPVVGNLNLFANISLAAITKLGPAKIYNIEILGTYSTDPEIQKSIQISGSINISAYAGLSLRAEGGAGIEIADHDLKFGIGINVDVGVKAYADARPTIGYRDPGLFYISGTLDLVAQPVLGLDGDFFIKLDSPFWSPAPDKTWKWPLFSKEWPLTNPIGLSATVKDYVLGSGTVPEIEFKKPEFDPSKFMTNMVDDNLPNKSGKADSAQGSFKEDGSIVKPDIPPKKPAPQLNKDKSKKGLNKVGKGKSATPASAGIKDQNELKELKTALNNLKSKEPYSKTEIDKELNNLNKRFKQAAFSYRKAGEKWILEQTRGINKKKKNAVSLAIKKDSAGQYDGEVGKTINFNADGESHKLWIAVQGKNATVMLASQAKPLKEQLKDFDKKISNIKKKKEKQQAQKLLININDLMNKLDSKADKLADMNNKLADRSKTDDQVEINETRLVTNIQHLIKLLNFKVDGPTGGTPGIGNTEKHGNQPKRLRNGPIPWWTESEHILPFAVGKVLWNAIELNTPKRGSSIDKKQTTINIYYRAARKKTHEDNKVSRIFRDGQKQSDLKELGKSVKNISDEAVKRTIEAVNKERNEKEEGFDVVNKYLRASPSEKEEPVNPDETKIKYAAEEQIKDLRQLLEQAATKADENLAQPNLSKKPLALVISKALG